MSSFGMLVTQHQSMLQCWMVKRSLELYLIFYWVDQFRQLLKPKGYRLTWIGRHLKIKEKIYNEKYFVCVLNTASIESIWAPTCLGKCPIPGESCWSNVLLKISRAGRMRKISLRHKKDKCVWLTYLWASGSLNLFCWPLTIAYLFTFLQIAIVSFFRPGRLGFPFCRWSISE